MTPDDARAREREGNVEREALLHLDGWHGRTTHLVTVIGETPRRYRVRLGEAVLLPSRRLAARGVQVLVPKYAVTFDTNAPRPGEGA